MDLLQGPFLAQHSEATVQAQTTIVIDENAPPYSYSMFTHSELFYSAQTRDDMAVANFGGLQ